MSVIALIPATVLAVTQKRERAAAAAAADSLPEPEQMPV
jgi:hypothetical protein